MIIDENDMINVLNEYNDYIHIAYIGKNLDSCFLFRIIKGIKTLTCTFKDCNSGMCYKQMSKQMELLKYE